MSRKFDLVVFGASGFTGQYVVEEIAKTLDEEKAKLKCDIKWAIAGREMKKLQKVLEAATKYSGVNVDETPILIADVSDETSLNAMCSQASVVINCVGPYRFYGTPVVKACIANGAHHIDICGEPEWLEKVALAYDQKARDAGLCVVQSCGFDSIPSDIGVVYTRQQFEGTLNSVEGYISTRPGNKSGASVNFGTWHSLIHSIANSSELKELRREQRNSNMADGFPRSKHKLIKRPLAFHSDVARGWCVPFPGADKSIVHRSMVTRFKYRQQRPVQYEAYLRTPGGLLGVLGLLLGGIVFFLLAKTKFGRYLLEKHPKLMTFGTVSKSGPSRENIEAGSCRFSFIGVGYEKGVEPDGDTPPAKKIITEMIGPEPGYVLTPICLVQSSYLLLSELDKLPTRGVLTPGAAFADTSLISRLKSRGVEFRVVKP